MKFQDYFGVNKCVVEESGFNPYYLEIQTGIGSRMRIDNREVISLGSNDYLGLANDPRLKEAAKNAIDEFGISMCGTPIVVGYTSLNKKLEGTILFLSYIDQLHFYDIYYLF